MVIDLTGKHWPELEEEAPHMAYRLLSGARCGRMVGGVVQICSESFEFLVPEKAYNAYERIMKTVRKSVTQMPMGVEETLRFFNEAEQLAPREFSVDTGKTRVLYINLDRKGETGSTFYRIHQPVSALRRSEKVFAEIHEEFFHNLALWYDIIVLPRISGPQITAYIDLLQKAGKKVVYETDDALDIIPDWSPVHGLARKESQDMRRDICKLCDAIIVSTPELKEQLGFPEKTYVCLNTIDFRLWPNREANQNTPITRILWPGSVTHKEDLALITPVVRDLYSQYKGKIQWVFVGSAPEGLTDFINRKDEKYVICVPPVPIVHYPKLLASLQPNIGIAPLVVHDFNSCKSEIKVLEYTLLGIPCLASDVPPYRRVLPKDQLIPQDSNVWKMKVEQLIHNPKIRSEMWKKVYDKVIKEYSQEANAQQYEDALVAIANRGK